MLSRLLTLILAILACTAVAAPAQTAEGALEMPTARAYNVAAAGPYVERGTAQIQVRAKLGPPTHQLSPEVWLYRNFSPVTPARTDASCRWLVILFEDGWVSDLKLANCAGAEVLLSQHAARHAARTVAGNGVDRHRGE